MNSFDVGSFASLDRINFKQRLRAEVLLIEELKAGNHDSRIVLALGGLHSGKAAPLLKERRKSARGEYRVNVALSLWRI